MAVDTSHGRAYRGRPDPLGALPVWDCPGCGMQNDARRPEEGCVHCSAGVPGVAGEPPERASTPERSVPDTSPRRAEPKRDRDAGQAAPSQGSKVYRLLEYTVLPGHEEAFEHGLRNSLVGRYGFAWGQIIATIVDSVDSRQADLIGLASRQPGVWLGGPGAAVPQGPRRTLPYGTAAGRSFTQPHSRQAEEAFRVAAQSPTPPTGPAFDEHDTKLATAIVEIAGFAACYTLAMALNSFAAAVEGETMEPEKYLTAQECLSLANALLSVIPEDWQPDAAAPPEGGPENG